jgi:hypothetical protein|tara:strand:+ start:176 stop:832 length:657 start_codon:yes stop_codon:yes gene_type:complete
MSFIKNKYKVLRKCVSKDLTNFLHQHILLKEKVFKKLKEHRYISEFNTDWGSTHDPQLKNCFMHYGDIACETLLTKLKPVFEKQTKNKLVESYAYGRIYNKGKDLKRHKDRPSCEISGTLNLGGDNWSIFLEPNSKKGYIDQKTKKYCSEFTKGIEIKLQPGDLLIYKGCELEHWRKPFKGQMCNQLFLHYNIETPEKLKVKFDGRESLGLPSPFKKI